MAGGEGLVARGVPVLRRDDRVEEVGQLRDGLQDLVSARHGQGAARQEVGLDVDQDQGFLEGHIRAPSLEQGHCLSFQGRAQAQLRGRGNRAPGRSGKELG